MACMFCWTDPCSCKRVRAKDMAGKHEPSNVVPATYRLTLDERRRRYTFTPLGNDKVQVKRYEMVDNSLKNTKTNVYPTSKARWVWKKLIDIGYKH